MTDHTVDKAALDRAILEAKSEIAALLGITTTRDTMTKEPVMWGDADGDCLTPEIAVQCALDKLIAEAEARVRDHAAQIGGDAAVEVLLRHEPDASPLKIQMTRQAIANPIRREDAK